MKPARPVVLVLSLLLLVVLAVAQGVPTAAPKEVGLSSDRLLRIDAAMKEHVEQGRMAGAVGLIARRGKVAYFQACGWQDREGRVPMARDAIFRMYSMTKPVTGVAVLILYEEGRLFLSDSVSKYIPELGKMKVAIVEKDPQTGKKKYSTVPAERDMTIRDLLRHTSGLDYRGPEDAEGWIYERTRTVSTDQTLAEMIRKIGQAPLVHQPGTVWEYGLSMDVLARVVEVVSGQPYDRFLNERIFKPLGMADTGYHVPAEKLSRLAKLYAPAEAGAIKPFEGAEQTSYGKPTIHFGGGSGLVSTSRDYLRFCQMLLNGGELDGMRILGRKTVELMSADHLSGLPPAARTLQPGYGFGLTVAVNRGIGLTGSVGSEGEYNWAGAAGTRFWIDPREQMIGLFMIQVLPPTNFTFGSQFKQLAYQAIVD